MGWLLDLVERLTVELVPPVPSSKSKREPPQPAQAVAIPPVLPVPPEKYKAKNTDRPAVTNPPAAGQVWLAAVAALLECEPAYLLEQDFIDHHDLVEQCGMPPRYAARLILSHPEWPHHQLGGLAVAGNLWNESSCGPHVDSHQVPPTSARI